MVKFVIFFFDVNLWFFDLWSWWIKSLIIILINLMRYKKSKDIIKWDNLISVFENKLSVVFFFYILIMLFCGLECFY